MKRHTLAPLSTLILGMTLSSTPYAQDAEQTWVDRVELSGILEFEAFQSKSGDFDDSEADLATFELGLDAALSDSLEAYALLLAEAPDHDIELDEGGFILSFGAGSLNLGKQYVPFGNYESRMISDPLTLELGETNESAATLGFSAGPASASMFVFNGGVDETEQDNSVDNYGFSVGLAGEGGSFRYDVGASYIDSIADTDGLEENFEEVFAEKVEGVGAYLVTGSGPVTFIAEYIAATDAIVIEEASAEPEAYNLELGYGFEAGGKPISLAVGYQGTDEAAVLGLPENKTLFTVSGEVMPALTLAFEYANEEDYSEADGGGGGDADVFTVQLALEF